MITAKELVRSALRPLAEDANKYTAGSATIFAGSYGMAGAAVLSAKAALRSGAGLVRLIVPKSIYSICAGALLEAVYTPVKETDGKISVGTFELVEQSVSKCGAVSFGCGMGMSQGVDDTLIKLLTQSSKPLLIDADGINSLSGHIDVLNAKTCPVVLTPHEGEMARLTGTSTEFIRNNRSEVAAEFASAYGVTLLLKGRNTVIANENGEILINPTGNAGLATAGSGDVLTGIITAFLCQGTTPFEAAAAGAYIHGLSGDFAADNSGDRSVIASDIIEYLPKAFKEC